MSDTGDRQTERDFLGATYEPRPSESELVEYEYREGVCR